MNFNTLDEKTRRINVHADYKQLGVESDEKSKRVFFEFPRFVDNVDLEDLDLYINYENAHGEKGIYLIEDKESSSDSVTFSWILSRHVTLYKGTVGYIVCAKKPGEIVDTLVEWNTKIATGEVSQGLEASRFVEIQNHDALEQIWNAIQDLLDKKHIHNNKIILDAISEISGALAYKGSPVVSSSSIEENLPTSVANTVSNLETVLSPFDDAEDAKEKIISMLQSEHTHPNKNVIDKFSISSDGMIIFDGEPLKVKSLQIVDEWPEDPEIGDLIFHLSDYTFYLYKYYEEAEQDDWVPYHDEELESMINALSSLVSAHTTDISNLNSNVNTLNLNMAGVTTDITNLQNSVSGVRNDVDKVAGYESVSGIPVFNGEELKRIPKDEFSLLETGKEYSFLNITSQASYVPVYDLTSRETFEIGFRDDNGNSFRVYETLTDSSIFSWIPLIHFETVGSLENITISKFLYNGSEFTSSDISQNKNLREAVIYLSRVINESDSKGGDLGDEPDRIRRYSLSSLIASITAIWGRKYYTEASSYLADIIPVNTTNDDKQLELYLKCTGDVDFMHEQAVTYNGQDIDTSEGLHKLIYGVYPKSNTIYLGESKLEA